MRSPFDAMFRWWKPASGNGAANGNGNVHQQPGASATGSSEAEGIADAALPEAPPAEPRWLAPRDRAGIPRTLQYPSTTLARLLDQAADRFGESTAIVSILKRWT